MNQLLEDVLTIGTAEAGRLEFNPEPLNLDALCREAVEEIQLGTQTRVFLSFSALGEDNQIVMDGKLLREILDNLLSNAIKYSPQGASVQMDVQCGQRMTTRVRTRASASRKTTANTSSSHSIGAAMWRASRARAWDWRSPSARWISTRER